MTERRKYGLGTVEPYRDRFRARAPRQVDGRRPVLGIRATVEEADKLLHDVAQLRAEAAGGDAMTLRTLGPRFLDARESNGVRDMKSERSRWKLHIATAHFADWPMSMIQKADIKDWLTRLGQKLAADVRVKDPTKQLMRIYRRKPRKLGPQSRKHCLNLIRMAFVEAIDLGHCTENPAEGIDAPVVPKSEFDYLHMHEQTAIANCAAVDEADRLRAMFSWGTGIRQFDQWTMRLTDLRLEAADPDMIIWCHKLEKRVRVQLFGVALYALKRWLTLLPAYCEKNERGLVWPLPSGAQRQKSKSYGWAAMLKTAGIKRHVIWHELRDTCATSLLMGWWGRKWTLREVQEMLHHSSAEVTERYAHFAPAALAEAARDTIGHQLATHPRRTEARKHRKNKGRATQGSNLRPSASEADALIQLS